MNEKYLKMNDLLNVIEELSHSQGFYGRLLFSLYNLQDTDPETYEELVEKWEGQHFKDALDFVLYLECA